MVITWKYLFDFVPIHFDTFFKRFTYNSQANQRLRPLQKAYKEYPQKNG